MALNIPAYFVTDGIIMEGFSLDPDNHQFLKMDSLPIMAPVSRPVTKI